MNKSKKAKKRHNRKLHQQALQNAETLKLLQKAKHEWPGSSQVVRGEYVRQLHNRGCSMRGLRDDLGYKSEASIARLKRIAELPLSERKQVEAGANPEPFLRAARETERKAEYQAKLAGQNARQKECEKLVQIFHHYMVDEGIGYSEHCYKLLDEVRLRVGRWENAHENDPEHYPLPAPAPQGADPKRIIEECRPKLSKSEEKDAFWFEISAKQLTTAIFRLAPDPEIRRAAIARATNDYSLGYLFVVGPGPNDPRVIRKDLRKPIIKWGEFQPCAG